MGRPIKSDWFGESETGQPKLSIYAKLPGMTNAAEGFIVAQKGTRKYRVNVNDTIGDVFLVNSKLADLNEGEGVIFVGEVDSDITVSKIQQYGLVAVNSTGEIQFGGQTQWVVNEETGLQPDTSSVPQPNNQTLLANASTAFKKENGTLWTGSGIPASGMLVSKNNIIELALSAHLRGSVINRKINDDGSYDISLTSSTQDWAFDYCVGIVSPAVTDITTEYDVVLTAYCNSEGKEQNPAVFTLAKEDTYVWKNTVLDGDITDSASDPDNRCVQNTLRYTFFKDNVVPPVGEEDPIVGTFIIKLEATHKTNFNTVSAKMIVRVTKDF
ncbi:hypothetical protein MIJ3_00222 [Pseudomonas phage vB_PaeM_MIJ3]|nr:hypothetical protein MIJ3_00222 [Pseudomonas phage vB_PaeM_MIJ3]